MRSPRKTLYPASKDVGNPTGRGIVPTIRVHFMTFRRYIVRNVMRNKRRSLLTILSIGISLFLLQVLLTFLDALFNPVLVDESALRLVTRRATSLADSMPLAYEDKIRKLPGVELVAPLHWFNGIYRDQSNFFANFAVDPEHIFDIYTEQHVSPEARAAFIAQKQGAVVGKDLMDRFGWKVGDRVTLLGTMYPVDLEFTIVGVYTSDRYQNMFYFHYDYFSESLGGHSRVGSFAVRVKTADQVPQVAEAIDAMFHNSAAETKTETEKAFVLGFMSMLGNVKNIVGSIALVVVFTMLLVSISTMSMAIRERLREVAILRAIGFSRRSVFALILGEAMFMTALGMAIGIGFAETFRYVDLDRITKGFIDRYAPDPSVYAMVVCVGVGIGVLSGLIPGMQAARMGILAGMRRVE